jgi:hypothetical protein
VDSENKMITCVTDRIAVAYPNMLFKGTWGRVGYDKYTEKLQKEYRVSAQHYELEKKLIPC